MIKSIGFGVGPPLFNSKFCHLINNFVVLGKLPDFLPRFNNPYYSTFLLHGVVAVGCLLQSKYLMFIIIPQIGSQVQLSMTKSNKNINMGFRGLSCSILSVVE